MATFVRADSILPTEAEGLVNPVIPEFAEGKSWNSTGTDAEAEVAQQHGIQRHPVLQSDDAENGQKYTARRTAHVAKGWPLLLMSFQAIGMVYGDIGTSPLYVLNGIWSATGPAPSKEDVIGVLSCIIWVFTIVVILKYALITLRFGTGEGEGGTFALFCGLFPRAATDDDDEREDRRGRSLTYVTTASGSAIVTDRRALLLTHSWVKPVLCAWALFGSGLTLSDGVLTPAVSVVSAAEGLAVVKPSLSDKVVPISIAILIALILVQPFGSGRISALYSPFVTLWLLFLAITGIVNIISYPGIWRAWDISRAVDYFIRTGNYDALTGVVLAVTGCEALFANLGQLNRASIQLPLLFLVYPSLMLAYLGQGAKLCSHGPEVISNVFYLTIPGGQGGGVYWIGFVLGLLATIIASQAMISGAFSIVSQLMHMNCFPMMKAKHTDDRHMGQIYLPIVNYLIGIGVVAAVAGFKHSANLTSAYGFAVVTVMVVTTSQVALQLYFVKNKPWWLAIAFFAIFGFVDCVLWGATLKKIPHGAWFSLSLGAALTLVMYFWTWATGLVTQFDNGNRVQLTALLSKTEDAPQSEAQVQAGASEERPRESAQLLFKLHDDVKVPLTRMPILAIFWKPSGGHGVPHAFARFLAQYPSCPRVVFFLSVRVLAVPHIPGPQRLLVDKVRSFEGFYGATLRLGYRDRNHLANLNEDLAASIIRLEATSAAANGKTREGKKRVEEIAEAAKIVTHVYPNYYVTAAHTGRGYTARQLVHLPTFFRAATQLGRAFLIDEVYRRMRAMVAQEDGPFEAREEIIRVTVTAAV